MARYVDGFVLPVPKKKVADYRRIARRAGRIWPNTALSNTSSASATISK